MENLTVTFYEDLSVSGHSDVADALKIHEQNIAQITNLSLNAYGQQLFEAKELIQSTNREGGFEAWLKILSISKSTAYRMIDIYLSTKQLNDQELHILEELPSRLVEAVCNKAKLPESERDVTTNDALSAVFSGDITTLPEFKAALAGKEQLIFALKENVEDLRYENNTSKTNVTDLEAANKQLAAELAAIKLKFPKVTDSSLDVSSLLNDDHDERLQTIEHHLADVKSQRDDYLNMIEDLQERLAVTHEGESENLYVKKQLAEANDKLRVQQDLIDQQTNFIQLQSLSNEAIQSALSPLLLSVDDEQLHDQTIVSALKDVQTKLNSWSKLLDSRLQSINT